MSFRARSLLLTTETRSCRQRRAYYFLPAQHPISIGAAADVDQRVRDHPGNERAADPCDCRHHEAGDGSADRAVSSLIEMTRAEGDGDGRQGADRTEPGDRTRA